MELGFTGKITDYDAFYHYFILNNCRRVHLSLLEARKPLQGLVQTPNKEAVIRLSKETVGSGGTYVIQAKSEVGDIFKNIGRPSRFIQFIRQNDWTLCHVLALDQWIETIGEHFTSLVNSNHLHLITLVLLEKFGTCLCRKGIKHMEIVTVHSLRFVEIVKNDMYEKFPFWSFGIHRKESKNKFVFGHIEVDSIFGFITISDDKSKFVCGYTNKHNRNLNEIVGSYVVLKDYIVMTEIFSEKNAKNSEFIFFDLQNVEVIFPNEMGPVQFPDSDSTKIQYAFSISFTVIRKANACFYNVGYQKDSLTKFWLQIEIFEKSSEQINELAFLRMPQQVAERMLIIEENYNYKLSFNQPLVAIKSILVENIGKDSKYDLLDKAPFIQKLGISDKTTGKILSVEECKNVIRDNTNLVHFEGTIKMKRFANNIDGSKYKGRSHYAFGTSSSKTHQLVFSYYKNGKQFFLDCYLCNFDLNLFPFGLIPNMKVRIRNVIPQSRKYVKTCIFTTFELLDYKPMVEFQTANLNRDSEYLWGSPFYLSRGNYIPENVLIWGTVEKVQIIQFIFRSVCVSCDETIDSVIDLYTRCPKCGEKERRKNFFLKLHVSDRFGQSVVVVDNPLITRVLFNLQKVEHEILMTGLEAVGYYKYDFFERLRKGFPEVEFGDSLKEILTLYLESITKLSISTLDLKVRLRKTSGKKPLWYCVDARRSANF